MGGLVCPTTVPRGVKGVERADADNTGVWSVGEHFFDLSVPLEKLYGMKHNSSMRITDFVETS